VLALIAQGRNNKEIASALGIAEGTVKCHVTMILSRLGVSDRTQAVVAALQRGIVHIN
jgi:DNA-binding NarL/FixJ family response regulator